MKTVNKMNLDTSLPPTYCSYVEIRLRYNENLQYKWTAADEHRSKLYNASSNRDKMATYPMFLFLPSAKHYIECMTAYTQHFIIMFYIAVRTFMIPAEHYKRGCMRFAAKFSI